MNLSAEVLTPWLMAIGWLLYLCTLGASIYYAPFKAVARDPRKQHFVFAGTLILAFFWMLEINLTAVLSIHPLLVTAAVLIFGWSLTLLMGSVALLALSFFGRSDLVAFPINAIVTVVIPACVTWLMLRQVSRARFQNIFLYILGAGFAGAALSVVVCCLAAGVLFSIINSPLLPTVELNSWPLLLLLMFPEGFINGTLVSATTVFLPHLVKTFDEDRYLHQDQD